MFLPKGPMKIVAEDIISNTDPDTDSREVGVPKPADKHYAKNEVIAFSRTLVRWSNELDTLKQTNHRSYGRGRVALCSFQASMFF